MGFSGLSAHNETLGSIFGAIKRRSKSRDSPVAPLRGRECMPMKQCEGAGISHLVTSFSWLRERLSLTGVNSQLEIKDKGICFLKVAGFKTDLLRKGSLSSNKITLKSKNVSQILFINVHN